MLLFVVECARTLCACRCRTRGSNSSPNKSDVVDVASAGYLGPLQGALRSVLFLDGSELIQSDGDLSLAALNASHRGFHVRGASWKESSSIAELWLKLARDGQLGSLWPRVERIAASRLAAASAYHVGEQCICLAVVRIEKLVYCPAVWMSIAVVNSVILLPGIQRGLKSVANGGGLTAVLSYVFGIFALDLIRVFLSSRFQLEGRRAAHVMQHALQAVILLKAAELGPGQASSGNVAALISADVGAVFKGCEPTFLLYVLPLEICASECRYFLLDTFGALQPLFDAA